MNQVALKVLANSAYGILSMEGCVFAGNNSYFSNSITTTGQVFDVLIGVTLGNLMDKINETLPEEIKAKDKGCERLNWVSGADTDSIYISVEPLVKLIEFKESQKC